MPIIILSHGNHGNREKNNHLRFCANCKDNSKNTPSKTRVFGSGMPLGRKYRKILRFVQTIDNEYVNSITQRKEPCLAMQYVANW